MKKLSDGKGICIRFHLGKCKSGQQCCYAHQCPSESKWGGLRGDSILPQGIRSHHTDLVHPLQCPMHVIQRSHLLQNFYHRLWFQSPRHRQLQVLKAEISHCRVQLDFFLIFFGRLNACEHCSSSTIWGSS